MIQSSRSRSGYWIFTSDGVLMASRNDPVMQAEQWVESQKPIRTDEAYKFKRRTIFVLGLGCGYHVRALAKICPRAQIMVIEAKGEILHWVFNHVEGSWESRVTIMVGQRPQHYFCKSTARLLLQNPYCVLPYEPAIKKDELFYGEWYRFLLARDKNSLETQMDLLAPLGIALSEVVKRDLLNMKDLKFIDEWPEAKIWKLFSEMVR